MPVPVRTTVVLDCIGVTVSNNRLYQQKVDVDMLNTIKNVLADISTISPLSLRHCSDEGQHSKYQLTHSLQHSAYPHQPFIIDTVYI